LLTQLWPETSVAPKTKIPAQLELIAPQH